MGKGNFINNRWVDAAGPEMHSIDPATGEAVWHGHESRINEIDLAVTSARTAAEDWSQTSLEARIGLLHRFADQLKADKSGLSEAICRETGKPRWESLTEIDSMVGKITVSIEAYRERCIPTNRDLGGASGSTRFRPHGVVAVLGPFNFPGHLPNGHIVPALLAGNTIVFKPSEMTPLVAEKTMESWIAAGLPPGIINMIQGGRETGTQVVSHAGIDGVFFTGSFAAGRAINRTLADQPSKILALEMGGNNPLIVHRVADLNAAAYAIIQSAFITAGQRCSCARRLIVPAGDENDRVLLRLIEMMSKIKVGRYTDIPEPFMGPVISDTAAERLLSSQRAMQAGGAISLIEMQPIGAGKEMLSPGLIDVTNQKNRIDEEVFGPLLQLVRVSDFDHAIAEANNTKYGLATGLLSDDRELFEILQRKSRAGIVNWNRPLTGASGYLPFGGVGCSGNHRPSAYFAADYCSYPVALTESEKLALPAKLPPGITI